MWVYVVRHTVGVSAWERREDRGGWGGMGDAGWEGWERRDMRVGIGEEG